MKGPDVRASNNFPDLVYCRVQSFPSCFPSLLPTYIIKLIININLMRLNYMLRLRLITGFIVIDSTIVNIV